MRLRNHHTRARGVLHASVDLVEATFIISLRVTFDDAVRVERASELLSVPPTLMPQQDVAPYRIENYSLQTIVFYQHERDTTIAGSAQAALGHASAPAAFFLGTGRNGRWREKLLPYHSAIYAWDEPASRSAQQMLVVEALIRQHRKPFASRGRADASIVASAADADADDNADPTSLYEQVSVPVGSYSLDEIRQHDPVTLRAFAKSRQLGVDASGKLFCLVDLLECA